MNTKRMVALGCVDKIFEEDQAVLGLALGCEFTFLNFLSVIKGLQTRMPVIFVMKGMGVLTQQACSEGLSCNGYSRRLPEVLF